MTTTGCIRSVQVRQNGQIARPPFIALWPIIALLMTTPVSAQQYKNLSGEYSIAGQTIIDPPPNEPTDTHLYFALTGNAARDLYNAMKATARADACGEPGGLLKSIGAMQCTRAPGGKSYQCSFAIDIAKQRISGGSAC